MTSRYDGIPDVRDGLTRQERVVLYYGTGEVHLGGFDA